MKEPAEWIDFRANARNASPAVEEQPLVHREGYEGEARTAAQGGGRALTGRARSGG